MHSDVQRAVCGTSGVMTLGDKSPGHSNVNTCSITDSSWKMHSETETNPADPFDLNLS